MTSPYIPPEAELNYNAFQAHSAGVHAPASLPAGRGLDWIKEGFSYFKQDAGTWILITIVGAVIFVAMNTIPIVNIFAGFFTYVFSGGLMLGAKAQRDGQPLNIGHLFAGFQNSLGSLLGLGGIVMGYTVIAVIIAFAGLMLKITEFNADFLQQLLTGQGIFLSVAILLVLLTPLFMGVWFAPALIVINKIPVLQAITLSIQGCLKNVLPLTINGLLIGLLFFVGAIPLMLGLLVAVPVFYISVFIAYKEIYIDP
ncbi:MAG TPA: BPSS1780 family membrane protein [Cellvibrionaceae bacterium]|nr:BPSS1780 family membrane protein [Cellvibrionaceae bacterium]HMW49895.1 BPSS1780 family membrane protein [Cellvibrionaceae bacterium]HMW71457.1 BPSS1780 family membrane protein [Cellvibrionaceae bacterium]HMY39839.1 BPSS1780 family membrane protein [Marinagarivorans sp.]HNG61388.1 BPSS1780 family membrane protein [Cellvibrionaceae bacterium]